MENESDKKTSQKNKTLSPIFFLALGVGAGTAIGVAMDQLALGVGLGAAIGIVLLLLYTRRRNKGGK